MYVYADTTNVKIPREMIMELPKYGNNLIWVDTAEMDATDLSHHIVLTIGQLINPEEEIDFYIVSKNSRFQKTMIFLRNQGIAAEMIAPASEKPVVEKAKTAGRRGRPRKEKPVIETTVATIEPTKKKRGRPAKVKVVDSESITPPVKAKRGRKPKSEATVNKTVTKEKPAKTAKETGKVKEKKEKKEKKPRKQRVDKEITADMVQEKLSRYESPDTNLSMVMARLFGLKKVARPKFDIKLINLIKDITLEDDLVAENVLAHLKDLNILSIEKGGRILYKD